MKKLAVCIPNYNKPKYFFKLINQSIEQIRSSDYPNEIEICISDDSSIIDITDDVLKKISDNPDICIKYQRNENNLGRFGNIKKVISMADSEFCWVIGNDDIYAFSGAVNIITHKLHNLNADILTFPLLALNEQEKYLRYAQFPIEFGNMKFYLIKSDDLDNWFNEEASFFTDPHQNIFRKSLWDKYINEITLYDDGFGFWIVLCIIALNGGIIQYVDNYFVVTCRDGELENWCNQNFREQYSRELLVLRDCLFGINEIAEQRFICCFNELFALCYGTIFENLKLTDKQRNSVKNIDSKVIILLNQIYISPERYCRIKDKNILLFGSGFWGKVVLNKLKSYDLYIKYFIDNNKAKFGKFINDTEVISPEKSLEISDSVYIIAAYNKGAFCSIYNQLVDMGISKDNIVAIL